MTVVDLSKNGHMDMIVFYIDHNETLTTHQNSGYYRVGRNLDTNGRATGGWSETLDVPGWFGSWNQGAGIALATLYQGL
jgi:hypothetical protein